MKIIEKNVKKQQKTDYFENPTKPSDILGEPSFRAPLLEKTNPILTTQISPQPLILQWFTTILFKIPQKKQTQLKPISNPPKTLTFIGRTRDFKKQLFMESKPNFKTLRPILTPEKKGTYNNSLPQKHKKSKPNPNPIQTQFQTQSQFKKHGKYLDLNT